MTRGEAKSVAACFMAGTVAFLIGVRLWSYAGPKLFFAAMAAALAVGMVIKLRAHRWRESARDAVNEIFAALLGAGICYLVKITTGWSLW